MNSRRFTDLTCHRKKEKNCMELIRNSKIIDKKYKEFDPTTY